MANRCSHGTFLHFGLWCSCSAPRGALALLHPNICYFHQDLHQAPLQPVSRRSLRRSARVLLHLGPQPEGGPSAGRLSAIHFQGRLIRQVSHNTLLGGCRLLWPPSCCQDQTTPFLVSLSGHSGALGPRLVQPTSPALLTKDGPLGEPIRAPLPLTLAGAGRPFKV